MRAGEVTGTPSRRVDVARVEVADAMDAHAGLVARLAGVTVTSTSPGHGGRMPHTAAAERWLTTADSPHASTAAISRVRRPGSGPTRKTPR